MSALPLGSILAASTLHAQPPAPFTEEAIARGVNFAVDYGGAFGCGLAFADLDNDGDPDLVTLGRADSAIQSGIAIYENDGAGYFVDRSNLSTLPPLPAPSGVAAGDYDDDGDLDLYIGCWLQANVMLRNDGAMVFTHVSAGTNLADVGAAAGCAWGDYDGDTWIDLYVGNRTGTNLPNPPFTPSPVPNRLFQNLGDGTFSDVAATLGVTGGMARTFQASFFDFDRDADADLYVANDKGASTGCGWRNMFWENLGGAFNDISASSGTDGCIDAMCIALGDFDGNRFQDIYVTNISLGNYLYLNQGNGTFTEAAAATGTASYEVGWGALFLDYDNDGFLDLYVCNHLAPNRLYDCDGTFPATDVSVTMAVNHHTPGESFCVATADIDDDGDLDLAVSNRFGRVLLYVNHEGQQRRWAKFRVVGEGHNRFGIGTNVDVRAGATWRLREVIAGSAFKSQDDLTLHVGLDAATVMDEIAVVWPGGASRTLAGYPTNQTWTLYPDARLGDEDGDGDVDLGDFAKFAQCFAGAVPGSVTPGCEMMDIDGDGDVDLGDFANFATRFTGAQ